MKTNELIGPALDWAVALVQGAVWSMWRFKAHHEDGEMNYSTDWSQGGPIIEREIITLTHPKYDCWTACGQDSTDLDMPLYEEDGPTPLIAAMRCYVASKLGDEVDIPEELQ